MPHACMHVTKEMLTKEKLLHVQTLEVQGRNQTPPMSRRKSWIQGGYKVDRLAVQSLRQAVESLIHGAGACGVESALMPRCMRRGVSLDWTVLIGLS